MVAIDAHHFHHAMVVTSTERKKNSDEKIKNLIFVSDFHFLYHEPTAHENHHFSTDTDASDA